MKMSFAPTINEIELPANWSVACQSCCNVIDDIINVRVSYDPNKGSAHVTCKSCFELLFISCEGCNENDIRSQMLQTDLGNFICADCKINYVPCNETNRQVHKDRVVKIGHYFYSPQAAKKWAVCMCCQTVIKSQDAGVTGGVCNRCLKTVIREYGTKAEHNLKFLTIPNTRKGGCFVTEDCSDNGIIKKSGLRYYGVELEVEHNKDSGKGLYETAKEVQELFKDFAIIKRDGSLQNGFEIVTTPATFDVHEVYWDAFFKTYKEKGYISSYFTSTCGMHVHVSKSSLTPLQIGKITAFIYAQNNSKFIATVAQRGSNKYNNFSNPKAFVDGFGGDWVRRETRHTAVNLTNQETIEIRLFKGTVSKDKFFKNLEFVRALIDFCESGVVSMAESKDHKIFCKFVEKYSTIYPNLYRFLVDSKYCVYKSPNPKENNKRYVKNKLKRRGQIDIAKAMDRILPYTCVPKKQKWYSHFDNSTTRKSFFLDMRRKNEAKFAARLGKKASSDLTSVEFLTFISGITNFHGLDLRQLLNGIDGLVNEQNLINGRHKLALWRTIDHLNDMGVSNEKCNGWKTRLGGLFILGTV